MACGYSPETGLEVLDVRSWVLVRFHGRAGEGAGGLEVVLGVRVSHSIAGVSGISGRAGVWNIHCRLAMSGVVCGLSFIGSWLGLWLG